MLYHNLRCRERGSDEVAADNTRYELCPLYGDGQSIRVIESYASTERCVLFLSQRRVLGKNLVQNSLERGSILPKEQRRSRQDTGGSWQAAPHALD